MDTPEQLCDLEILTADYRSVPHKSDPPNHVFRISVIAGKKMHFDVAEKDGELFAAELETLAAIIRSRAIRA
jgi:hypothetical protein